jgi:hypothetical protein
MFYDGRAADRYSPDEEALKNVGRMSNDAAMKLWFTG